MVPDTFSPFFLRPEHPGTVAEQVARTTGFGVRGYCTSMVQENRGPQKGGFPLLASADSA